MAKTKHNHVLDTIDEIITDGKKKGVLHLYTEDEIFTGRHIQINGKKIHHFGTTGYLGLEQDERLKKAAIDAIMKYGTQFPLSKTYLSMSYYRELEECLQSMYNYPLLVSKNSTLGHIGVIPSVVRDEDAVILDHQVHSSVQNACNLLKPRGIKVDMIRHSNMEMLEEKIKEYGNKYRKIWYMADGVYSMYGDCAPLEDLLVLLDKYPTFHLYIDDVHGMSWAGKNGTGYVLSKIKELHPKMVLMATLSKSFGASGAVVVFPDEEACRKVKTFGGPQTFSAQLEPAAVAAATASAKIHLSPEIYDMQKDVAEKIAYCNGLLRGTDLPLIEENSCPVFFIPTGLPAIGYNLVNRIINEGFYVNLGVFPAVPVKNTGIRFTISRHNQKEDIKGLIEAFAHHYPKALEDEHYTQNKVRKAFNMPLIQEEEVAIRSLESMQIHHTATIEEVDQHTWNDSVGRTNSFDWVGMQYLEKVFRNNQSPEDNWEFDYFTIKDKNGNLVLSTFFTTTLWKDDMLAPPAVSIEIESKRALHPYYLTSRVISMGSLITEGEHCYLDNGHPEWRSAIRLLFEEVSRLQEKYNTTMLVLRDFEDNDDELKEYFINQGFIKIDMPETCVIENLSWNDTEEFLQGLSYKSRANLKREVLRNEHFFDVEVKKNVTEDELRTYYDLYMNVKSKNYDINNFAYPFKMVEVMNEHPGWEFIEVRIKPEFDYRQERTPAAVVFCYLNSANIYTALLIGIDYQLSEKFGVYRQALYLSVLHARNRNAEKLNFGYTAPIEKKKLGARIIPKVAYIQCKDNYALEFIESIAVNKASA